MKPLSRLHAGRGPRILTLALMLAVMPAALAWPHWRVDLEFHALWMLLGRARTLATTAGPVTVRFTDWGAVVEDRRGAGHPVPGDAGRGALPDHPERPAPRVRAGR